MLWLMGCRLTGYWEAPEWSLQRMVVQRRVGPYQDPREPPDGVVPWDPSPGPPQPAPLDRDLLAHGRDRFEVFCAPCHGVDGAAQTPVALAMTLPPRDLRDSSREDPDRIRLAIEQGYGLMPAYGDRISGVDEQAVVAWVQVLQRIQVNADELTPEMRARLEAQ